MPYKIVQTIQDEKLLLIAVPSQWENKGILKWPKKKFEKLRRNEESVPKEKWSPMNCIVKRKNLTLQQADDEIDYMCKNSDTENSENISCKTRKMQTTTIIESPNCSFNNLAEECEATNHHQRRFSSTAQNNNLIFITQENKNRFLTPVDAEIILDSTFIPNIATEKESTSSLNIMHSKIDSLNQNLKMLSENVISKIDLLTQNLKMLTEKVIVLQKNQLGLYDAEQNTLLSLSNISTQLEEIVNKFLQPETNFKSKEISFDAISDKESFDLFEKKLQDSTYQEKLLEKMSLMCGTSRGKGINNAYALVDIIFARDFLQKCSWAGGSRSETAKICFKSHKNAVQFFFKVVNLADRSFSLLDTENFFKVILRNSRKRNESLRVRMSVTKTRVRRQKSITNQSVQEAQNSDIQQGQQQLVHQPFSAQPAQVLCSPDGQLQVLPESSCTESLG